MNKTLITFFCVSFLGSLSAMQKSNDKVSGVGENSKIVSECMLYIGNEEFANLYKKFKDLDSFRRHLIARGDFTEDKAAKRKKKLFKNFLRIMREGREKFNATEKQALRSGTSILVHISPPADKNDIENHYKESLVVTEIIFDGIHDRISQEARREEAEYEATRPTPFYDPKNDACEGI